VKTNLRRILLGSACALSSICMAAPPEAMEARPLRNAQESFEVERLPFGSGTPSDGVTEGTEAADFVADGLYHLPNYLPGFPTAATIWPREVAVECETGQATGKHTCSGYRMHPVLGRGEYVFIRPVAKAVEPQVQAPAPAPAPVIVKKKPLG